MWGFHALKFLLYIYRIFTWYSKAVDSLQVFSAYAPMRWQPLLLGASQAWPALLVRTAGTRLICCPNLKAYECIISSRIVDLQAVYRARTEMFGVKDDSGARVFVCRSLGALSFHDIVLSHCVCLLDIHTILTDDWRCRCMPQSTVARGRWPAACACERPKQCVDFVQSCLYFGITVLCLCQDGLAIEARQAALSAACKPK